MKNITSYTFLFFSILLLLSCKKETVVFEENFDNNTNKWDTLNSTLIYNKIENGKLIMSSKVDNVINLSLVQSEFLKKNISLAASIIVDEFYDNDGLAGMILFADNQKFPENYIFFGINNFNEVIISKESKDPKSAHIFYKEKISSFIPDKVNRLSIKTTDNSILFLINQNPVVHIEKPIKLGKYFGFIVLDSKITADDLVVKSNN